MAVGDAQISEKHCNFFVNKGNAKSRDLEQLINQVQSKVLEKTGINLELELQIIGEKLFPTNFVFEWGDYQVKGK
jgi:UDP-N-acetylmuramate dehydrogenase